jgi:hypothetical protein
MRGCKTIGGEEKKRRARKISETKISKIIFFVLALHLSLKFVNIFCHGIAHFDGTGL